MPASKTIALLPFRYNHEGQFHEGNAVTISETTYRNADIDARIRSTVMRALMRLTKETAGVQQNVSTDMMPEPEDGQEQSGEQFMLMLAGVMDQDDFAQFFKQIKFALTNNSDLAKVAGTTAPITQQTWDEIAESNGLSGWYAICGDFLSFFFENMSSRNVNGSGRSTTSASPMRAESPAPRLAPSRGPN